MLPSLILPLICLTSFAGAIHKLPANFPKCHKKDADIDMCVLHATQTALVHLKAGNQQLGIYPLDPLKITELKIGNAKGGSVSLNLEFKDLILKGISTVKLTKAKTDIDKYFLQFFGTLQEPLLLNGQYKADGRVLILPIQGKGDCKLKLENVNANFTIHGKEKKMHGARYMAIEKLDLHFTTSKLHLYFHQLIGGPIGDNLNVILNENWEEILKDLQPGIEEALSITFKDIAQRIFSRVPYDSIFL